MEESKSQPTEALEIATDIISELMYRQKLYPESTAERFAVAAVASKKSIWLFNESDAAGFDNTVTRPDFTNLILEPIFRYRQNNQDIATLYQWTNYHAPFSPRVMQLIETTMTLDKNLAFADQMRPESSTAENIMRGEFLSGLVTAMARVENHSEPGPSRKISISAAAISGQLDLAHIENIPPLEFTNCLFDHPLDLSHSSIASLNLRGSKLPALDCCGTRVKGGVTLASYFRALGPVNFTGASVGGVFKASGGQFRALDNAPTGQALTLKRARLNNNLLCGENFVAEGLVNLTGLECKLDVAFRSAQLLSQPSNQAGTALLCNNAEINGNLKITDNCSIIGSVYLRNSRIGGNFEASASAFQHPIHGTSAAALTVENSRITGFASLQYASLTGRTSFENSSIGNDCIFNYLSAVNDTDFTSGPALVLTNMKIGGGLFMREATLRGNTAISNSQINGNFDARRAEMENLNKAGDSHALSVENLAIGQAVKLSGDFTASGAVLLSRVVTGNDLSVTGGNFKNDLHIHNCRVNGALALDNPGQPTTRIDGELSLRGTKTKELSDNRASWPDVINQHGFRFHSLSPDDGCGATERLNWLARSPSIDNTAYEQLIDALEQANKAVAAKRVAIEQARVKFWQRLRQLSHRKNSAAVPPHDVVVNLRYAALWPIFAVGWLFYGGLLSYGFSVARLGAIMAALLLVATGLFYKAETQRLMAPLSPLISLHEAYAGCRPENGGSWTACDNAAIPAFSPLLYSADLLTPYADLGHTSHWRPLEKPISFNVPGPRCLQWAEPCFSIKWIAFSSGPYLLSGLVTTLRLAGWVALLGLAIILLKIHRQTRRTRSPPHDS